MRMTLGSSPGNAYFMEELQRGSGLITSVLAGHSLILWLSQSEDQEFSVSLIGDLLSGTPT